MGDEHDEILKLASEFCEETFEEDEDFVMKSFEPEQAAEIKRALSILNLYLENYPDDVKTALQTLARLAVEDVEEKDDQDDSDEDDEDQDKKRTKKKGPKWSFSFGVIDEDDNPIGFEKGSEIELIEEIAENFEVLDDLLKTSALLGREVAKQQNKEEISEKIDRLNNLIEKIARAKGIKKGSGDNDKKLWSFSLVRPPGEDEDDE